MNKTQSKFNYGEALQKSNLFYLSQRSGDLPKDNAISWRGDSALNDGADVGRDLTGGYYDAGDHVKFGFPMASSMTMLAWGVIEYRDGYEKVGQLDETLDNIKWGTDYILKAYDDQGTATVKDDEFWGQVGDGDIDHAYWGKAEDMQMERPAFKVDAQNPGSDLTAESAAALASASIAFRSTDKAYADKLLEKAKQLYEFADKYQGAYSDSIPEASSFYNSWSGYQDELAWGATWLHKAVEAAGETDTEYLEKAESYYTNAGWTQDWDNKSAGTGVLLAQETGKNKYKQDVEGLLDDWAKPNGSVQKTDGGLAWLTEWASLRYSANTAFLAGVYGDTVNDKGGLYTDFSNQQVNYILGDNPNNFSYMVGFGDNSPENPHHRGASGTNNINDSDPNEHILYGALVGGPSKPNDNAYKDERTDYVANEVALDYNAGLTGALARMTEEFGGQALTKIPGVNLDGGSNPIVPASVDTPDVAKKPNLEDSVDTPKVEDIVSKPESTDTLKVEDQPNPIVDNINPTLEDKVAQPVDNINPGSANEVQADVAFTPVHEWNGGFTGKVQITNNSSEAVSDWELEFSAPFEIKEIWNGSIESQSGNKYLIADAGWNASIAPGQSVHFGFNGSNSDDMKLALNGVEFNQV